MRKLNKKGCNGQSLDAAPVTPTNHVRTRNGKLWLSSGYETHKNFDMLVAFFHEHCDSAVMAELVATHPNMRFDIQNTTDSTHDKMSSLPILESA